MDPYKNFKFRVEWQGQTVAHANGFSDVSGLGHEVNYAERQSSKPMFKHWGDPHEDLDGKTTIGGFQNMSEIDSQTSTSLPPGRTQPESSFFTHSIQSPRDKASGAATGGRQLMLEDASFEASSAGFQRWLITDGVPARRVTIVTLDERGTVVSTQHYSVRPAVGNSLHSYGSVAGIRLEVV